MTNEETDRYSAEMSDEHPEHPEKTILEDLKEKYPNYVLKAGTPVTCVNNFYGMKGRCKHNMPCSDCWNRPLSEVKHD